MANRNLGSDHGVFGAGTFGANLVSGDATIVTVADYPTMIASGPTQDTVFVVLDDTAGTSGTAGIAHYSFDLATGIFEFIASQAGGIVTGVTNALHLTGTLAALGGVMTEVTVIDGATNTFPITFQDNLSFTVDNTDFNVTRGNFTIFNDATGAILGLNSVGFSHISGTEIHGAWTDSTTSRFIYNNTATGVINQIRTNTGGAILNSQKAGHDYSVTTSQNNEQATLTAAVGTSISGVTASGATNEVNISSLDATDDTNIKISSTEIDVDVKTGEFFLNEGLTASGANTATVGQILTLQNVATGLAHRADAAAVAPIAAWVDNGLHVETGVIHRGGTLIENTTIDGAANTYSVEFMDNLSFTVSNTDFNTTQGDFTLFNDATSVVGGGAAVGSSWIDGVESISNYVDATRGSINYTNTTSSVVNEFRATSTRTTMNTVDGVNFNGFLTDVGNTKMQAFGAGGSTKIEQTDTTMSLDVALGELFVNEGTTGTGTGTATNGMVLTLIDDSNGECEWTDAAAQNLETFAVSNTTNTPMFLNTDPIGTTVNMPFDDTTQANADFTLGGGGVITCNTTGDYNLEYNVTVGAILNGTSLIISHGIFVNGVLDNNSRGLTSHNQASITDQASRSLPLSLTIGDTLVFQSQKLQQTGNRQAQNFPNLASIYITKV